MTQLDHNPAADLAWTRLLAPPRRGLYLHFLNRELGRAIGLANDPALSESRLLLAALLGDGMLYAPLSFVWESEVLTRPSWAVGHLHASGQLDVLSEYADEARFLDSVHAFYAQDASRYWMYFDALPPEDRRIAPTVVKPSSTTADLQFNLLRIAEDPFLVLDQKWLTSDDARAVAAHAEDIGKTVERRERRALTLSLFDELLAGSSAYRPVGRLLTGLHIRHYLDLLGADIVTGLGGPGPRDLRYFDRFAREPPRYDATLASAVLARVGVAGSRWETLAGAIAAQRLTSAHTALLRPLRALMAGTWEADARRRGEVAERLPARPAEIGIAAEELVGGRSELSHPPLDRLFENLADRLAFLDMAAEARHRWYRRRKDSLVGDAVSNRVLFLVASPTERDRVLQAARDAGGNADPPRDFVGNVTIFHLGIIAGAELLLAQSEQGIVSPGAMTLVASEAVKTLRPDFVIMVGIAFGLRPDEQELGDVLVSTQVRVADHTKVTVVGGVSVQLDRGDRVPPNALLLDRFRSSAVGWTRCGVHFGPMLAENRLVDDPDVVRELRERLPELYGGEMEGAGLYSAAAREQTAWIIVKGLSDWGYDKQEANRQRAAANAASYAMRVVTLGALSPESPMI